MKKFSSAAGAVLSLFFCDLYVFAQSEAAQPGKWAAIKGYMRVMGGIVLVMAAIYFIAVFTGKIGQKIQAGKAEETESEEAEEE